MNSTEHSYSWKPASIASVRWILFGTVCGLVIGLFGSLFAIAIRFATNLRDAHPQVLFLLPLLGCAIIFCYHRIGSREDKGTNTVISAIRSGEHVPPQMAPLIFLSTVLTHLGGGSAGREGAALQLGGSISDMMGRLFRFHSNERRRVIMCGMSAAFSALFGTPLAAAIFAIEVSTVGLIYDSALVPCAISALTARAVASLFGLGPETYVIEAAPAFTPLTAVLTVALSALCGLLSTFFCVFLHRTEHFVEQRFRNEYLRIVLCAAALIVMTLLVGSQTYNGAGAPVIEMCLEDEAALIPAYAFLLKMLFTAVTLSGGFKGGEIVPSLFVGATFGTLFGRLVAAAAPALAFLPGMSALGTSGTAIWAAVGMGCMFCGVTNCPIASILICFEMFGFAGMPFCFLGAAIAYMTSGHFGLYHSQKILYSKFEPGEIDSPIHD